MKLKAIHLIRRMERIDRDIEELNRLQLGIREDRDYSRRIMDPLLDEAVRLKKLRSRILAQTIKNPPENLIPVSSDSSGVSITVSGESVKEPKKKVSPESSPAVKEKNPQGPKKGNPYKFIFEQDK